MLVIRTKRGRIVRAKRAGDVVLKLRAKEISREDTIKDPELGQITVGEFVDHLENAADTCATLEIMVDDLKNLLETYQSWPPKTSA